VVNRLTGMNRHGLLGVATSAAIALAGCGGDSNKQLSYSDFSKKADEICKEQRLKTVSIDAKISGRAKADAHVFDQVISVAKDQRTKFEALKPPDELQADFDKFNAITDQSIGLLDKAAKTAQSGNQAGYQQVLTEIRRSLLGRQRDFEASKLGAIECTKT
jgi:hypothetical protein